MSDQESITAKLDEAFVELMIRELAGQSRPVSDDDALDSQIGDGPSAAASADGSFEAMVTGEPTEGIDDTGASVPTPMLAEASAPIEEADLGAGQGPTKQPADQVSGQEKVVLEITEPNHRERVFRVHRKPVVIGRGRDNDITLRDTKVSRQHLQIELVEGRLMATDLNSQNGTQVNGRTLREQEVISGDEIMLGGTTIRVRRVKE